ncbi:unnamed protein product [Eruca vesicaria subsp. sativa]|uniref:NAC domain-containing protein n=1 Tax=Eruca vesicaria subsp. sativa TaxID=29727 RepID=A0ABC8LLI0_ERUVS|nr:unnamed protein product [Eruca vesicaria subsp. sativa]
MEDQSIISQEDMEDHFTLYQDSMEEDHSVTSQEDEDQIDPEDEVIISYYLNMMINNSKSWPHHFLEDEEANVYNLNPACSFNTPGSDYCFVFVKRRNDSCGKTDGSDSGCWRVMARDKLIKSKETGRILGFKKILKFCEKEMKGSEEEEEQIIWVMEEYRLADKRKQDQVICKIRFSLQPEVTSLLAKQFSFIPKIPFSRKKFMPRWDLCIHVRTDEIISYHLKMCVDKRNDWPSHFLQSEQVYGVAPWMIVDTDQSSVDLIEGSYFFTNRTERSGRRDGCEEGCWRIMRRDRVIVSKRNKVLGFKRMFKFCVKEDKTEPVYKFWGDEKYDVNEEKVTWVMEEYRLAKKKEQGKVICRICLLFQCLLKRQVLDF